MTKQPTLEQIEARIAEVEMLITQHRARSAGQTTTDIEILQDTLDTLVKLRKFRLAER